MKKLRIAMIGQKRVPSREGGVEVVVEELSTRMASLGYEITCYNRRGHHVSGKEFDTKDMAKDYKGVRIKNVYTINIRGLSAMSSSIIGAIQAAFGNYDIVHFHAEGSCGMLWIPKLFGKRCIVTIHGLDWARSKWGYIATKYIKFGEAVAVKYADEIIVLSKNIQNYFNETYRRDTVYIPNGVNKPEILEAKEIINHFDIKRGSYILFLGRLVPEKGVSYLIKAYKGVNTDKKLIIAGGVSDSGDYFEELKSLAQDDDRIQFTGFVQGRLLKELYSNAYVYVLPSDLEGMPLSLLEAMSYGNCVLGSDIDEIIEVVSDKAVIFMKSNVLDLQGKLQMLCDDIEKVQVYKNEASAFICGKYNWDKIVNSTLNLYHRQKL